jgi:outer membrane autotransporter protein
VDSAVGMAISATTGNEFIDNYGAVTGSVDLGAGSNAFNNKVGGLFNAGSTVNLGSGNLLTNAGVLSPGGKGTPQTTAHTGKLDQKSSGTFSVDLNAANGKADRLDVSETADLAGIADITIVNPGWATPGKKQVTVLSAAGGVTNSGLSLASQPSGVINYELLFPNPTDVAIGTEITFSPRGLNANQKSIGDCIDAIQQTGGSESFAPIAAELFALTDGKSLAAAYDQLDPESYTNATQTSLNSSQQNIKTIQQRMHSLRASLKSFAADTRPGWGVWLQTFGQGGNQESKDSFTGYSFDLQGITVGLDRFID